MQSATARLKKSVGKCGSSKAMRAKHIHWEQLNDKANSWLYNRPLAARVY